MYQNRNICPVENVSIDNDINISCVSIKNELNKYKNYFRAWRYCSLKKKNHPV